MEVFDGKYKILGELGSGGMSSVYRCVDTILNREVALKVLHTQRLLDQNSVVRFKREGLAIATLNHENIVKMHGLHFTADQQPYLTMEVVHGQSLEKIIQEQAPLRCELAIQIARQIATALAFVHSKKIIHRDLKPANIMIDDSNKIKLLDFGIAKFAEEQNFKATRTGESIGTPAYMSPEQITGKAVDARTDQYSLGCVLFEMLTGRPPYDADNSVALSLAHSQEAIPAVNKMRKEKIPKELESMVATLLAKNQDDRFTDMVVVREKLVRLEAGASSKLRLSPFLIGLLATALFLILLSYALLLASPRKITKSSAVEGASKSKFISDENFSLKNTAIKDNAKFKEFIAANPNVHCIGREFSALAVDDDSLSVLVGHNNLTDVSLSQWIMLTDKCADYLVQLPLTHLCVSKTKLTDKSVLAFAKLKQLNDLDLSYTRITNKSCEYLSKFDSLGLLSLSSTSIDDIGLKKMGEMPHLEYLSISYTPVKDIAHSLKMNNIDRLSLEGLTLKKEDFERINSLKKLYYLNLSDADYDPANLLLLESPTLKQLLATTQKSQLSKCPG